MDDISLSGEWRQKYGDPRTEDFMDRFDPKIALEELTEDATLPHPVRMRDMILRIKLELDQATEINREFQNYLSHYGESQRIAREILEKLAVGTPKNP
jgi:hypothetical protein